MHVRRKGLAKPDQDARMLTREGDTGATVYLAVETPRFMVQHDMPQENFL